MHLIIFLLKLRKGTNKLQSMKRLQKDLQLMQNGKFILLLFEKIWIDRRIQKFEVDTRTTSEINHSQKKKRSTYISRGGRERNLDAKPVQCLYFTSSYYRGQDFLKCQPKSKYFKNIMDFLEQVTEQPERWPWMQPLKKCWTF